EDGIRRRTVTGVQTCALPIWDDHSIVVGERLVHRRPHAPGGHRTRRRPADGARPPPGAVRERHTTRRPGTRFAPPGGPTLDTKRSEERRVGKACRSRWTAGRW